MHESDVEQLLRRYQPAGPPPELETRIFAPARPLRTWPWATAAAALLALTAGLHVATNRLADRAVPAAAETRPTVDDLTAAFGGGDEARRVAELILLEQQARAELVPPPTPDLSMPAGPTQ